MRITQWGEYGIHCSVFIARAQSEGLGSSSAQQIADEYKIAVDYAQQILQRLRKAGIIEGVRGPHGGYRLAKSPDQITLGEILSATEGSVLRSLCESKPIDGDRCSESSECGLRELWGELENHLQLFLSSHSLSDLVLRLSKGKLINLPKAKLDLNRTA